MSELWDDRRSTGENLAVMQFDFDIKSKRAEMALRAWQRPVGSEPLLTVEEVRAVLLPALGLEPE